MKITVTQKDIDRATKLRDKNSEFDYACYCPIALAVKRKTRKKVNVSDYDIDVMRSENGENTTYHLPAKAASFIYRFDDKLSVKPFTFETSPMKW